MLFLQQNHAPFGSFPGYDSLLLVGQLLIIRGKLCGGDCISYSCAAVTNQPMRNSLRKEGFVSSGSQFEVTVRHSRDGMAAAAEGSWSRQEAVDERSLVLRSPFLFVQSKS